MAAILQPMTLDERAKRGMEIYTQRIQPALRPQDDGKFVAIDINTGAYELGQDEIEIVARLKETHPNAEVWLERVGRPSVIIIRRMRR